MNAPHPDHSSSNTGTSIKRTPALSVNFDWVPIGSVSLDGRGRLDFPRVPSGPGLYQFELVQGGHSSFYTGQADNLPRRFQHYRTPGPSQQTNMRLNRHMTNTLTAGGGICASVITEGAMIDVGGEIRSINLGSKFERVLLEHAAIAVASAAGFETLNR